MNIFKRNFRVLAIAWLFCYIHVCGICQIKDPSTPVMVTSWKFDGFTTVIRRNSDRVPKLSGSFSFEAWIAAATYQ